MKTASVPDQPRIAIITGASSGIGRATAIAFARRGYLVVVSARRIEKLQEVADACRSAGGEAVVTAADVADRMQVDELVASTVRKFGRLDVMVNNAGFGLRARVHETSDEQMREIFDVNFHGLFYGCRAAAPVMMRQRSGHIFNVSSVIGKRGSPFNGAYCATKFAVVGLTDSLRVEMLPYNVRVTCVCPALTDTEFFDAARGGASGKTMQRFRGLTDPRIIGRRIAATVGKTRPEIIFTAGGKLLAVLAAISPRLTDKLMKIYHDAIVKEMRG
jgi:NAD(P)-dependent dehydrogenase (short-subunit alcohol dehydrogenase family)